MDVKPVEFCEERNYRSRAADRKWRAWNARFMHSAMHAPDGRYHGGYERMIKERSCARASAAVGEGDGLGLPWGTGAIFYYLNGMPGRLFVG